MATFDQQHPHRTQATCNGDTIVRQEQSGKCCKCGTSTQWASLSFMAYFCSAACLDAMWREYWAAEAEEVRA